VSKQNLHPEASVLHKHESSDWKRTCETICNMSLRHV